MSSGGAGGDDGDTDIDTNDDTDGAGSNETDGGGDDSGGGNSLSSGDVSSIATRVLQQWIRSLPPRVKAFFQNPVAVVLSIVIGWLWGDILRPLLRGLLEAGIALITAVLSIGQSIVAIGQILTTGLISAARPVGGTLLETLGQFNGAIATAASGAGLAAPAVVTLLYALEAGLVLYAIWSVIEVVDVPIVDLGGIARVATAPFRLTLRLIR